MTKIENEIYFKERSAGIYIRHFAYQNGDEIYRLLNKYNIGESDYGRLMDFAGRSEACHRLYGHHIIFDMPFDDPGKIHTFLEHLASDIFTKQGLPIIPGELLNDSGLLKYCKSLKHNYNFVNFLDILSGTLSIQTGVIKLKAAFNEEEAISSFEEVAKALGIGALELAIALSSANPFLLIGAALNLVATAKMASLDKSKLYFNILHKNLIIEFKSREIFIGTTTQELLIENNVQRLLVENQIEDLFIDQCVFKSKQSG